MRLTARDEKLMLSCTYEERDFPKLLKGRWNGLWKSWSFPSSIITYNTIIEEAQSREIELIIDKELKEEFDSKLMSKESIKENGGFKTPSYKHQTKIMNLILANKRCFVFAGVGTGKSKAAIDAVTVLNNDGVVKKCLVVSPASIMWNFANEIKLHSYLDSTIIYGDMTKRRNLIKDSKAVFDIVNYDVLEKLNDELSEVNYDMVIFDEIHYCKSRNSNRAKAAYELAKHIGIRVGLTGTIISNAYEDLFMPFKVIDETVFGPYFTRFKDRYCITTQWSGYEEIVGYKNEDEIKKLVSTNSIKFDIRDVLDDLPDEQNIIKEVHLEPRTMKIYRRMQREMIVENDKGDIVAKNILERLLRLSQITSGYVTDTKSETIDKIGNEKISVLRELLSQISEKTVIFCRFRKSIDRVVELCNELKLSYYIYDGRTKEKDLYLKFNTDDTRVWIGQLQKSEGYSIPAAQYCIFFELDYSRKNHIQSRGRILRATGSKHSCLFYIYLIATNTIDEAIYKTLKDKDFTSETALEFVKGMK